MANIDSVIAPAHVRTAGEGEEFGLRFEGSQQISRQKPHSCQTHISSH